MHDNINILYWENFKSEEVNVDANKMKCRKINNYTPQLNIYEKHKYNISWKIILLKVCRKLNDPNNCIAAL